MSRNVIVTMVVGLIVLVGAGGYLFMNQQQGSSDDSMDQQMKESDDIESEILSGERSILELMERQDSFTCTYEDDETNSTGTVYVGEGNFRGDFEINSEEASLNSHMLTVDDIVYIWSDDSEQGVTFSVENIQEVDSEDQPQAPETVDLERKYSYDCDRWNVDSSLFDVPEDIEFIDMGEFMNPESMMGEGAQGTSEQCAACESLSGDARTQCLNALGC